jgi:N-methylhydantoinase B
MMQADPILTEVVARSLTLASEEMGATLIALAFSPNIKERWDCSSAIFDAAGNVIAQANRVPLHLGSMIGAVEALREKYPLERLQPGDMFLANDPYSGGGTHLPDINILAPVFVAGRVVAFVANIAHHADVGGMVSGSESTLCATIFQEGIRLPMVQIARAGVIVDDILDIVRLNSRTPDERQGDLQAQFAACRVGTERVGELFARYGVAAVDGCISNFLKATGEDPDARLHLHLSVTGGRLRFDFSDCAQQLLTTSRNVPRNAVLATVYAITKSMLDPDVPSNSGYFDAIEVVTRPCTLTDPVPPAAVGTRSITCGVLGDLIVAALSQAVSEGAMADSGPHHLVVFAGPDAKHGAFFVDYETIAGGSGARVRRPGLDSVRVHASGAANLPIEALENAYPLRVERYSLREGSGGKGVMRGGDGVVRDYRVLGDGIQVSLSSARQVSPAQGFAGGGKGLCGAFLLNPNTDAERKLPSAAVDLSLQRGDLLRVLTPGGGGMGQLPPSA